MGTNRGWRGSRIFLAASWIMLSVASLVLIATFLNAFLLRPYSEELISLDWAGYVVVSNLLNPQPVVVGVSGSWTVPTVNASQQDSFCAAWIGIGGHVDDTLIQTGTQQDSIEGTDVYGAWYELLPDFEVPITTIDVSPGDKIAASINLVDAASNQWLIEINDVTKEQKFKNIFFYTSSRLSAEWIVERPTVNNSVSTLAAFGSITFTNASAETDTTMGAINNFPFVQVTMNNRQNKPLVNVSPLASNGSSFTVNYLSSASSIHSQLSRSFENKIAVAYVEGCEDYPKKKDGMKKASLLGCLSA